MKFIHLTDLHIAPDGMGPALAGTTERAARAVSYINAHHRDAEFCILTGDIVYDPDPLAYALAQDVLSGLTVPLISLIGNHDDRNMALRMVSSVTADPNGFAQQSRPSSVGQIIGLDTKADSGDGGRLCAARLDWLAARLEADPGPCWIFMHHAPFATGLPAMDTIGLDPADAEALGDLLERHGNVRHLFFGHYHRPMSGQWRGIPFSAHRSMMVQCALELEASEHVPGVFEEPQLAIVLASQDATVVHYHDFLSTATQLSLGPATPDADTPPNVDLSRP